jgi:hypothetical protein
LHGMEIENKLNERIKDLKKYAYEYFIFLNKQVDIAGTDNKDKFKLSMEGDKLKVEVIAEKTVKYSRTIDPSTTDEVRLFGKANDDTFLINTSLSSGIKIFLIGGTGKDTYESAKPIKIDDDLIIRDNHEKNNFDLKQAKVKLSNKPENNTYNRKSFQYDYSIFFPNVGYNPDDGFLLGFNYSKVKNGFLKWPYSSKHSIVGNLGFTSKSYTFKYSGEFISLAGDNDFIVEIDIFSPQNVTNFFGSPCPDLQYPG